MSDVTLMTSIYFRTIWCWVC